MCWMEGEKNHSRNRVGKNRIQPTGTEEEGIWRDGKQNVNAQSRHERCAISARCRAEKGLLHHNVELEAEGWKIT